MGPWWFTWFALLLIFLVLYLNKKKRKKQIAKNHIQRKKERSIMQELAKRFINKDCYITLIEGTADGVLVDVTDGGVVLEKEGKMQVVNLDYILKIREYPYNKKGKRALFSAE